MTGDITTVPVPLHSAFSRHQTILIFMLHTQAGPKKIFYNTKLDRDGNPPRLKVGQRIHLTDAILNIHPAGDFHYATKVRLVRTDIDPGTRSTPKTLQDLYERVFHATHVTQWLAQGWHDAASLMRETFTGCTESNTHMDHVEGTPGWHDTKYRLSFALEDDPRVTAEVNLAPDDGCYQIIFLPHAVAAARATFEQAAAKIPTTTWDHQTSPMKTLRFPDPTKPDSTPELALEFRTIEEAIKHRNTVLELAQEVKKQLSRNWRRIQ